MTSGTSIDGTIYINIYIYICPVLTKCVSSIKVLHFALLL